MKVTSYLFALYILGLPLVSYAHEGHEQSGFAGLIHYLSDPMHVFLMAGGMFAFSMVVFLLFEPLRRSLFSVLARGNKMPLKWS